MRRRMGSRAPGVRSQISCDVSEAATCGRNLHPQRTFGFGPTFRHTARTVAYRACPDGADSVSFTRRFTAISAVSSTRPLSADTCRRITLSTNYRSHPKIIEFYNNWMDGQAWEFGGKNFRFEKTIKAREATFPDTTTVIRVVASDSEGEAANWYAEVLAFLHHLREHGSLKDWNQVAFLFRSVKNDRVVVGGKWDSGVLASVQYVLRPRRDPADARSPHLPLSPVS